ncbi:sugar phosphate isomerase/epimerase family protein [Actinomadura mexicana]|uniref:Sugar phosphate isomerase/epimerase n=1 Tax=Actinomadura mexicana TaxID=134959 RepID=A0A238XDQ1_9ACTN|nr:sugar phosphate isomerase/epimerase [Actinomadura mexicana]SNR57136.1 Sugar phosphate isomerase/epimerase [Actinomadura mexicana]
MKLSCCDHGFPLLEHETVCDLIRLLGFEAVNIALWSGSSHVRPEDVRGDIRGWAERIGERTRSRGLTIADLFLVPDLDYAVMAVNNPSADERARGRAVFEEMLEFARLLGVEGMTLIPGLEFEGEPHDRSLERAADELAMRVAAGAEAGVRVSVEPHIGSVIASPEDTVRLLEMVPELGVTLDYSHFVMQGHEPAALDPVLGRVRHFHARAAREGRLQVGMRDNEIDFGRAITALREAGYDGVLATEYLWMPQLRCDECDVVSETVQMRDLLAERISH